MMLVFWMNVSMRRWALARKLASPAMIHSSISSISGAKQVATANDNLAIMPSKSKCGPWKINKIVAEFGELGDLCHPLLDVAWTEAQDQASKANIVVSADLAVDAESHIEYGRYHATASNRA